MLGKCGEGWDGGNSWDWKKWLRNGEMLKKGGNGWDRGNGYITCMITF